MSKIMLISGHGYQDPGAVGNGTNERDFIRNTIVDRVGKYLKLAGHAVAIYGKDQDCFQDTAYGQRIGNYRDYGLYWVASQGYDIVVEFHLDASNDPTVDGGHVIIAAGLEPDGIDKGIQAALDKHVDVIHGISGRNDLLHCNVSKEMGINYRLVELGFITAKDDMDYIKKQADAFCKDIADAINQKEIVIAPPKVVEPKKAPAQSAKKDIKVPNSYRSKKGETLESIAKKYGITVTAIKSYNSKLPDNIKEGTFMYLKKQTSSTYKVQKGDTLYQIAKQHKVGVYDLMDWNNIKTSNIKPGTLLKVKKPVTKKVTVKRKPFALSAAKADVKQEKRTAKLNQIEAVKFAQASVGQYFDYDGKFNYQCFDWANAYWHEMFNHGFAGMEAANIPTNNKANLDLEATVYRKTENNRPQPGDILIWDWTPWEHKDFGHVAVALKCGTNGMTVIEQNADGKADKPVNMRTCNYNGVTYFIRPNYKK